MHGLRRTTNDVLMHSLDSYLRDAEQAHGHLCAGQVLGVRLAMLGLQKLGIEDPLRRRGRRRDWLPPGKTGAEIPRLGESRSYIC